MKKWETDNLDLKRSNKGERQKEALKNSDREGRNSSKI